MSNGFVKGSPVTPKSGSRKEYMSRDDFITSYLTAVNKGHTPLTVATMMGYTNSALEGRVRSINKATEEAYNALQTPQEKRIFLPVPVFTKGKKGRKKGSPLDLIHLIEGLVDPQELEPPE